MKTIGIITYHHYYNYGTMLQAYALQRKVCELGYDAELIDFKQDNSLSIVRKIQLRIRRLPVYIKEADKYRTLTKAKQYFALRINKFEEFYQRELVVGEHKYTNTEQLMKEPPQYDAFLVGSDQTWNPYVANAPEAFYLPFVEDNNKKGSYGPSLAVTVLSEEQRKLYRERLKTFEYLSCREEAGSKLLEEITEKKVTTVLDPTLLLTKDEWLQFAIEEDVKGRYILTYFLGDKKEHRKFVEKLSENTGLKIVSIPFSYLEIKNPKTDKRWGGPGEFISLIKNAAVVCTDSFHGTMFSINFNSNFYSFCKMDDDIDSSENSRLYSSLDIFGLSERLIKNCDNVPTEIEPINYEQVNEILCQKRNDSERYLKKMLENITKG